MPVSHVKNNSIADWAATTVTVANSTGGTNTINASDLVRPSDWNSAHNEIRYVSGNTVGDTSAITATNIVYAGRNGMELYVSTAASAATIYWDNDGLPMKVYEPDLYQSGTAWSSHPPASTYFMYFSLQNAVAFNKAWVPKSVSIAMPAGTSSNTQQTWRHGYTHYFSLFSRKNYGASSDSLTYMTHGSLVVTYSFFHTQTSMSALMWYNTDTAGGTSSTNSTSNATANLAAYFNGPRMAQIPFPATTLEPGEYWIAQAHSTSQAATSGTATTVAFYSNLHQVPNAGANFARFASTNATSSSLNQYGPASRGVMSAITSNADMAGSAMSGSVVNNWYCVLANI